ncbi:MAG: alpha/beta hydrolase family protein [Gammaproteobacteria bacterium SHHR-1]
MIQAPRFLLLCLFCCAPALLTAADLAREQRISADIERYLSFGQALRLKAGQWEFLALHEEADSQEIKGGVILLHDWNGHADRLGVIQHLRIGLTRHGWETLSLQLPLASEGAPQFERQGLITQALPRIQAAGDYYAKRNIKQTVLIGHGLGARMALAALAGNQPASARGLVLIGMALDEADQAGKEQLRKIQLPLLDLMGQRDSPAVLASKRLRRKTARYGGNRNYRQVSIIGADHEFYNREQMLLLRIVGWLNRHLKPDEPGSYKGIGP